MNRTGKLSLFAACAALIVSGCSGTDNNEENNTNEAETRALTLDFAGVVGESAFKCDETYPLGTADSMTEINDFKLYIHDIKLIREGGERVAMKLDEDGKWQAKGVVLLDFEDKTGTCSNGTADLNSQAVGVVEDHDDYTGVEFTVGLPFELNHNDSASAPAPLNFTGMWWNWQGGYKFVRVDGKVDGKGLRFHLGSTGCTGVDNDIESCAAPNRATVTLEDVVPGTDTIKVDLEQLFAGVDLTPGEVSSAGCMSEPDNMVCEDFFSAVGLDFGSMTAGEQTFFRK